MAAPRQLEPDKFIQGMIQGQNLAFDDASETLSKMTLDAFVKGNYAGSVEMV